MPHEARLQCGLLLALFFLDHVSSGSMALDERRGLSMKEGETPNRCMQGGGDVLRWECGKDGGFWVVWVV